MMNEGGTGRMPLEAIGPDARCEPIRVGLAPPEFLVLMDIDCGVAFPPDQRAAVGIARTLDARIRHSSMMTVFERGLAAVISTGTGR